MPYLQNKEEVYKPQTKSLLTLSYTFASFFGAFMIATSFAYYTFKYQEYKFINFDEVILYEREKIFEPKHNEYLVVVYTSRDATVLDKLLKTKKNLPVLAVDMSQKRVQSNPSVTFVTSSMSMLLQLVQRFNIHSTPTWFVIKRDNKNTFKQDSAILQDNNF